MGRTFQREGSGDFGDDGVGEGWEECVCEGLGGACD